MKITVAGGGSAYTPELVEGFGRRALVANPLVRQWESAAPVLDALLEVGQRYLPRFFGDADV